jgi:hypothetical protein
MSADHVAALRSMTVCDAAAIARRTATALVSTTASGEDTEMTTSTKSKPIVYIASPYTKGDPAINARFQCQVFDELMADGKVWPYAPLWSHFQHSVFPRHYQEWIDYDLALLPRFDACLRLNSEFPALGYVQAQSSGADGEVALFAKLGKPVFYNKIDLYTWLQETP